MIGHKQTEETRKKISETRKAKIKKGEIKVHNPIYWLGKKRSKEDREKMSKAKKGKLSNALGKHWNLPEKVKEKMRKRKHSEETKRKMSLAHKGDKSYLWKGGKSFEPYSTDWTETLRRAIRERDNYICQKCSQYGNIVHHIDYDKKNCNPENLITLCRGCNGKVNQNRDYWTNYFKQIIKKYD